MRVLDVWPTDAFNRQFERLPQELRRRVRATVQKLKLSPSLPGLNVERVRGAAGKVSTCRVSDGVRLLFEPADGGIHLLAVGGYDAVREALSYYLIQMPENEEACTMVRPDRGELVDDEVPWSLIDGGYFSLLGILHELDVPEDDRIAVEKLIRVSLEDGTDGRATPPPYGLSGPLNVIPGSSAAECTPVLVAFCFDADRFSERLHEISDHAGIHCPQTRVIVLVTSQWDMKKWKRNHQVIFSKLAATLIVFFAGAGPLTRLDVA